VRRHESFNPHSRTHTDTELQGCSSHVSTATGRLATNRAQRTVPGLIGLVLTLLLTAGCDAETPGTRDGGDTAAGVAAPIDPPLRWRDRSTEDAGSAKVLWELVLPPGALLTEPALRSWLQPYADSAERVQFRHHTAPTLVDIKVYASDAHLAAESGQWVAWWSREPDARQGHLSLDDRQLPPRTHAESTRRADTVPLPEPRRRSLFEDIVRAEDVARAAGGSEAARRARRAAAHDAHAQKHHLTRAALEKVSDEALRKGWPLPRQ
jgi:hypothetical protein